MDSEVIFWLVALLGGIAWLFWAIRKANKEQYVYWISELKDKH